MSSPHVAGAAALILESGPRIRAQRMGALMQNQAKPKPWSGNAALGLLDFTHRQGAGMLDIPAVLTATATATPGDLALGESESGPSANRITVENQSRVATKWTITHEPAVVSGPNTQSGASYNITGVFDAPATVVFDRTEFTTPARGEASFTATITANPALPDRSIYGGYIKVTSEFGKVLRVPYAGFKGDYQSTQVLTPTANGFPWLAQLVGTSYFNRSTGGTFTMVDNDIPFFLTHLDHLSRRVFLEVRDAVSGRQLGKVSDDEFVTRNSTPGGFFAFPWDGITFRGDPEEPKRTLELPNGQYTVTVWVLKALGEKSNAAHWESWTSPVVTIARP
jgi:hypothetical protein